MDKPLSSNLTDLQRSILHAIAANPDDSTAGISDKVGCSTSYVREVQNEYSNELEQMRALSSMDYLPSFAHPYSILLGRDSLEEYHLSEGDVLQLTFEINGVERTTYGKVELFEDGMLGPSSKELQARVYGSYFSTSELQESEFNGFDQFDTLDGDSLDGCADLPTDTKLREFIQTVQSKLWGQVNNGVELLIGVGILEIVHGERDPSSLINSPYFVLEDQHFPDYFENNGPKLVDVELYLGERSEPEEVYFTYYGEKLDTAQIEILREKILDIELFKSSWNYSLPGYRAVVGPTTTDPTSDIVRVSADSLEVVEGVERSAHYFTDNGTAFTGLDAEVVEDAIRSANPQFQSLASHTRYAGEVEGLPLRRDADQIFFLFDQVTLVLTAHGSHITWMSPIGIKYVEKIIRAVNDMIETQLELSGREMGDPQPPQYQRISQEDWAFDTNALYHDHVADQPTSILHTIFDHRFFHSSTIHVPWAVLFEMNKHPESGSASKATNEQGFQNLSMLKTLRDLEYLSLNVQTPPEKIHANIGNGDVADMLIFSYADSHDAQLVTGDESLANVSNLSDTPAVNISQLSRLSSPVESDEALDQEVFDRIGKDLNSHSEIMDELEETIDSGATLPAAETSNRPRHEPDDILQSWQTKGEILPYIRSGDGERCYAQCVDVTIIPTRSALDALPSFLDGSGELLTDDFLKQISDGVPSLNGGELPAISLLVPSEYIVEAAVSEQPPSESNSTILNIANAENIEYCTEPAALAEAALPSQVEGSTAVEEPEVSEGLLSWEDYLALCLATSRESAYLLVVDLEQGLWKFTNLFGIDAISLSTPGDTDQ